MTKTRIAAAFGFAGALALGAGSCVAAPMPVTGAAIKAAAPTSVTDVYWRGGWGWGGGWVPGAILGGLALGAIGAASAPYWYGAPYGYGYYRPYGYAYAPGPYYYGGWGGWGGYGGWHRGWRHGWHRHW